MRAGTLQGYHRSIVNPPFHVAPRTWQFLLLHKANELHVDYPIEDIMENTRYWSLPMKNTIGRCFTAILLVSAVQVADASEVALELKNRAMSLTIDREAKGSIASVRDIASSAEFIAAQAAPRLFSLTFSRKDQADGERFYLSSRAAKSFSANLADGVVTLQYDGLGPWPIQVTCTAQLSELDGLVHWRLSAKIPEPLVLEEVQFPLVVLRAPLGDSGEDDAAVFGHTKGGVIRKPVDMKIGSHAEGRQPGSLAAQFGCYYDSQAGFYLAAYDNQGVPKEFAVRRTAEGVEMGWKLYCFAPDAYAMDFDVVMTSFAGGDQATATDWRDGADIYKQWALQQPWCSTLFAERTDIPTWMKEGPAMVRFNRQWLADPSRIERWVTDYWQKHFPESPLITAYWGWEKVGYWVTPDYFPVFPSDEQFTDLTTHLRQLGCHAFPWPSGYHWTLTYRKQDDGNFFWDDRQRFDEVARAHAVLNRDGQLYIRTPSWLAGGDTACLCPGDPWTTGWWNQDICAPLARRGCEMIQVDQVVGGAFPFCYSRNHSHPLGPGRWMTEVFENQLTTMRTTMKEIQPDSVVCVEEPNERFNHLVGIQDYRDCESPHQWASVFNYLYHEFLPTFQSNPRPGDMVMAAYCLVNGQMPHLSPSPRDLEEMVLGNGGFEPSGAGDDTMAPWEQVRGYQGRDWNGRAARDVDVKHGGVSSLRLENSTDADIVQVSQNVQVTDGGGLTFGRKYRLSAWMQTGSMARTNAINFAFFAPGMKVVGQGGRLIFPAAGTGWSRLTAEFTVPAGADLLRIMIHVEGQARVWVDDMQLEELLPDATTREARYAGTTAESRFMRRWAELYHGEGRPWLQFGRMLHPPKLACGTITYGDRQMPAVFYNAFQSPDGAEAAILANASAERQSTTLSWKGRESPLMLEPSEVVLVK